MDSIAWPGAFRAARAWGSLCLLPLLAIYCTLARAAPEPVSVAPGVYALIADKGEISTQNRGVVGNAGFIVGSSGVVVIDTGISYRYGNEMLASIASVTALPIELAIISHPVQEFLFGAAAFQERGIPVLAQQKAAELMRNRCEACLKNLRRLLGEDEMRGSRVVTPDRIVDQTTRLSIGGRELDLLYFGWASTPGDLAIFDRITGVLFAGGLISVERIPELRDADLQGWIKALKRLNTLPIKAVVPAHGPVVDHEQMHRTLDYLGALEDKVRELYRSGASLTETIARAQLPAFQSWSLYSVVHPQNVQHVYLRLENEDFN